MKGCTSFTINNITLIDSCQFMLSSLDKLSRNLNKDQFKENRKYLESFCVEQRNHPQTNNLTEGGEEDESMHVHEDYLTICHPYHLPPTLTIHHPYYLPPIWHPYHPPTLTSDQQQQIEEDLALMTRKVVYPYEYKDSFEWFQEPQLPPKDAFYSPLTKEDISETDYTHA